MRSGVRSNWRSAVLVCRKCSKKLDGGFGADGDERLAKALRRELRLKKGRKAAAGVIEVDCLDVCPKGAVVVVDTARPDAWMLVRPGTPIDEIAGRVGLSEPAICSAH